MAHPINDKLNKLEGKEENKMSVVESWIKEQIKEAKGCMSEINGDLDINAQEKP